MTVNNINDLKVAAFIAGYGQLYEAIATKNLIHVPMDQYDTTRNQITRLGYSARYRFRGPRIGTDNRHTLKKDARAFTVYLK
jgi:hypothetical protein